MPLDLTKIHRDHLTANPLATFPSVFSFTSQNIQIPPISSFSQKSSPTSLSCHLRMIFGSKEQKTRLAVFLKHMNVCLLKKSRSSGQSQFHSEAYFCHQRLLSVSFAVLHPDCLHLCLLSHLWSQDGYDSSTPGVFTPLSQQKERRGQKNFFCEGPVFFIQKEKFSCELPTRLPFLFQN